MAEFLQKNHFSSLKFDVKKIEYFALILLEITSFQQNLKRLFPPALISNNI